MSAVHKPFIPAQAVAVAAEPDWRAMGIAIRGRVEELRDNLLMDCSTFTSLTGMKIVGLEIRFTERNWKNPITKQWQRIVEYTLNPIVRLPKGPGEP